MVDNKVVESGIHTVVEDGNLCIQYESDKVTCKDVLKVDVSGGVPKEGSTITIIGGQIKKVNLKYEQSTIVKNTKGELTTFVEKEYEVGDEVVFNPGTGDETWNVISEDVDTVTLMLNHNLATQVKWYAPARDNSYGPITALNYLNTQTTGWTNVDPMTNYVYVNNPKGTTVPYGYQKLEINNGITKIIAKDGKENLITGETKARLITLEELYEIAQDFNENYKEENLRGYIEKNISAIKTFVPGSTAQTVDQVIEEVSNALGAQDYSKYQQTLQIVLTGIENGVDTTYDVSLPDFLFPNALGYYTLTPRLHAIGGVWYLNGTVKMASGNYVDATNYIRPVITIPKSKLK